MKSFILCLCFTLSLCAKNYHENEIWGQPCIDDDSVPSPGKSAEEVIRYTTWIIEQLDSYKDEFIVKLEKHYSTFNELIQVTEYEKEEWLRKFDWYIEEILPNNKLLGQPLPQKYIEKTKIKMKIEHYKIMTKINAALKFILGTFNKITKLPVNAEIMNIDLDFRRTIYESEKIMRTIICSMNNYMKTKNYQIEILLDDFLPKNITHHEVGLMLRDTFNYLEYIKQLFEALKFEEYLKTELPYESDLWANPCHYSPPVNYYFNKSLGQETWKPDPDRATVIVQQIDIQAKKTLEVGLKLKDNFAQLLLNYPTFNELLADSRKDEWLRKIPWYKDEVLPKSKELLSEIEFSYITKHLIKVFDKVIPLIHKGAKMILSGLNRILNLKIYRKVRQPDFQSKFEEYINEVQHLLCLFSDYLRARGHKQLWLFEENRISSGWTFAIYRDSLNYAEYISNVFEYIARYQALGLDPYNPDFEPPPVFDI